MTKEQMRVEINMELGWIQVPDAYYIDRIAFVKDGQRIASCDLPNYPDDLNACHEMEKHLSGDQWYEYWRQLYLITKPKTPTSLEYIEHSKAFIHATAEQRCIAFLKTIGRWKE